MGAPISSPYRTGIVTLVLLGSIISVSACSTTDEDQLLPEPSVPPGITQTPTPEPTPTEAIVELRLWMPQSLAPSGDDEAASILNMQLFEFDVQHPDATVHVSPKIAHGRGGLLDLLRTASPVAPASLPDVIMLSDGDLAIAAREGLVQPLDDLLTPESEDDLFNFARSAARIDNSRVGVPIVADINHLVFNPNRLDAPITTWSTLISDSIPFPFTFTDDGDVSDAVLADYDWLGGSTMSAEGQPALDIEVLTQLLGLFQDAREASVIAVSNLNWSNQNDAWAGIQNSGWRMTVIRASQYLSARREGIVLDYGRTPSIDGGFAPPIGRTWNIVLVSRDPRRKELAIELIMHLSDPENVAAWTTAQAMLPASKSALEAWSPGDAYTNFIRAELNRAIAPPSPAAVDAVSSAFMTAIQDVVAGRAQPSSAAAAAVEAIRRGEN